MDGYSEKCKDYDKLFAEHTKTVADNVALRANLEESKAETAACLEFMAFEMHWEGFREEMLYASETKEANASKENMRKLSNFLKQKNHGVALMQEIKRMREASK
jgi:hypothetical protein